MLPSLANLGCDTEAPKRRRSGVGADVPDLARKERRTPILVNGEWVRYYRHAPLDKKSIRHAVDALHDPSLVAAATAAYGPIAEWDTSEVENFTGLFGGKSNFTADLSGWDVGNATDMGFMFAGASSFDSDLSKWDVGKVVDMSIMFKGATRFTSDLSKWNVGNVEYMGRMFSGATRFTSDLSKWNVGSVKRIYFMFQGAASFNSDLSKWNVGKVEDMSFMFWGATSFNSDLSKWDVRNVTDMTQMFDGATSFTSDLSEWDVGNVKRMSFMFDRASSFTSDLSEWDVGNVEHMGFMFEDNTSFGPPLDISYDSGWTPESLAKHVAFVKSSPILKTYRARRRWRDVRELWYVARSVVRALLIWTEERLIDEKRYHAENPAVRQQLEDGLEGFRKALGLSEEFLARARRLCEILIHTNHSPPTQTRLV